jgi:hypothetical protein
MSAVARNCANGANQDLSTLNKSKDRDQGWGLELAIPWSSFAELTANPVPKVGDS